MLNEFLILPKNEIIIKSTCFENKKNLHELIDCAIISRYVLHTFSERHWVPGFRSMILIDENGGKTKEE